MRDADDAALAAAIFQSFLTGLVDCAAGTWANLAAFNSHRAAAILKPHQALAGFTMFFAVTQRRFLSFFLTAPIVRVTESAVFRAIRNRAEWFAVGSLFRALTFTFAIHFRTAAIRAVALALMPAILNRHTLIKTIRVRRRRETQYENCDNCFFHQGLV